MQRTAVIAGAAAAVVVVGGAGVWWAVAQSVDAEAVERGTCGSASWVLSAEAEDGGTEVSAELQSAGPGEVWDVSLTRDDSVLLAGTRTTDEDGEIDVDVFSSGAGDATYSVTFTPTEGEPCAGDVRP